MDGEVVRWPRSPRQVGGKDKLVPGSNHAASFRYMPHPARAQPARSVAAAYYDG
jgi:hypothetical protein